jgi:hypothetical protein
MRRAKPRLAAFAKSWGEKPLRRAGIYNRAATARSATQAAIRAGYSPNSAAQIGHENLRKPEITLAIQEALRQFGGITQTRLIDELGRLAFSDIGNSGITMSSTSALPLSAAPRAKQPA